MTGRLPAMTTDTEAVEATESASEGSPAVRVPNVGPNAVSGLEHNLLNPDDAAAAEQAPDSADAEPDDQADDQADDTTQNDDAQDSAPAEGDAAATPDGGDGSGDQTGDPDPQA